MIISLALIFLTGFTMALLCRKAKIPPFIGMMAAGIILGPCALDFLDDSIMNISMDLRQIALIIILFKVGLSLNIVDLRKVGVRIVVMSFLPAIFEIVGCVIFAPTFLGMTKMQALIMGTVLGAVSPAVVASKMLYLISEKYGVEKSIPQMIMAGASLNDILIIVLFSVFVDMTQGDNMGVACLVDIPISVIFGVVIGAGMGIMVGACIEKIASLNFSSDNIIMMIVLIVVFVLAAAESWLNDIVSFSGPLAVLCMACAVQICSNKNISESLAKKFKDIWVIAEVVLFVLVGASVDIKYTVDAGFDAIALILLVLAFRLLGVFVSLAGTKLTKGERLFCAISYIPKATVQAVLGFVPLAIGMPGGNTIQVIAVLSIIITSPLGAVLMDTTYKRLLKKED